MRILSMLVSFLIGRMNKSSRGLHGGATEIMDLAVAKSRKIVMYSLTGLLIIAVLSGGFFMALTDSTAQYDRNGFIGASATLISGVSIMVLAIFSFAFVFLRAWPNTLKQSAKQKDEDLSTALAGSSGLEKALAILVLDYVKEREFKRQSVPSPLKESFKPAIWNSRKMSIERDSSSSTTH